MIYVNIDKQSNNVDLKFLHDLVKEYDTRDLTVVFRRYETEGRSYHGEYFSGGAYGMKSYFGKSYRKPLITMRVGYLKYPYKTKDCYGVEYNAKTEEEMIGSLFLHEFRHYLNWKLKEVDSWSEAACSEWANSKMEEVKTDVSTN